jgi:hypothetical protein
MEEPNYAALVDAPMEACCVGRVRGGSPLSSGVSRRSRFMHTRTSVVFAALLTLLVASCSRNSPPAPRVADLGVVEVTNGGTNRITCSDGRVFVVRSLILIDQQAWEGGKSTILKGTNIVLMISQEQVDSRGVTRLSDEQNVGAKPGQAVGISDGITHVRITPKIKSEA